MTLIFIISRNIHYLSIEKSEIQLSIEKNSVKCTITANTLV